MSALKVKPRHGSFLLGNVIFFFLVFSSIQAQTIMFDDFTYTDVNDLTNPANPAYNKWTVVNGTSGPPEGAKYDKNNVKFITDPTNANNRLMTLSTTANGQTKAVTHSRIETDGFEYFEGTYAARVYITDEAFNTKDANIQTFFTIVSSSLAQDGSKYSELDIVEYMAADKWGTAPDKQVLYTTSYHKYIADPWTAWKTYFASVKSWAGWHTFIASCTDGVNVKYWIDNNYLGAQSVTDNETQAGLPVYPRSNMQIAFANWIWNNVLGSSTANRTNTMQVDWVLHYKNTPLTLDQINTQVNSFRSAGIQRRNLSGQTYSTGVTNQPPTVALTAPANNATYTAPASITLNANASDADGSITKVEFYNGSNLLGTDNTSPYSYTWTNVPTGSYNITAKATDNGGASTSSASVTVTVSVPQSPYKGSPISIPGTVEAEDYDLGGQNIAYNETTPTNEGGAYRTSEAVDIEPATGGGYDVGYIIAGEWMEYTVNVTSSGTYTIDAKIATTSTGKSFRLELDGTTIGTFNLPNTNGWQVWQTVTLNNVSLSAGQKVLRLYAITSDFNVDKIIFTKTISTNQPPTVSLSAPSNNSVYTAPANITLSANAADADGTISKVDFYNGTVLLYSDVSSPYSYSWTNVAAGTYVLTAKATDNSGASSTSGSVSVTVNPSPTGPVIVYQNCNNDPGYEIGLSVGTYSTAQLIALGIKDNDISRLAVQTGYKITVYDGDNLSGNSYSSTSDVSCLTSVNFNDLTSSIKIETVSTQSPYGGIPATIPGIIEAERYDLGGQGVAYNDLTPTNEGGAFRTDAVDIEPYGSGYDVGYILTDEWMEYTVNVTAGSYKIDASVAAIAAGKTFRLELDSVPIANFNVPNTGAWQTFQTVTVNNVTLTGGQKILRLYATSADFNVDKLIFTAATNGTNTPPSITLSSPTNNSTYNAPASVALTANASDADGSVTKVEFFNGSLKLGEALSSPYTYTWTNVAAGTYTLTAKATDNSGATTVSSTVSITVNNLTQDACSNIPQYVENGGYAAGSRVKNKGSQYECKPWPYNAWCNASAWAYEPGYGYYWSDAWTLIGACTSSARSSDQSSTNENVLSNQPNPFSTITTVTLETHTAGEIKIEVYSKTGQLLETLNNSYLSAGSYEFQWNASELKADVYVIKCTTPDGVVTQKMMKTE